MHAWVDADDLGREVLTRTGTGAVTALVPLGVDGLLRVEISCTPPPGRARAIRYSVHGTVAGADPVAVAAADACATGSRVAWAVRWHRHEGIPGDLPIGALDLATDARAVLVSLAPLPADADVLADLAADIRAPRSRGDGSG
ncbi:MAG: hypothetical protein Q8M17_04270 [Actinomycetota bacterium]|nr:hypothetical protein [Actinomycetota bacterium]